MTGGVLVDFVGSEDGGVILRSVCKIGMRCLRGGIGYVGVQVCVNNSAVHERSYGFAGERNRGDVSSILEFCSISGLWWTGKEWIMQLGAAMANPSPTIGHTPPYQYLVSRPAP